MKAAVFAVKDRRKPLIVFIRGDLQVNEAKLRNTIEQKYSPSQIMKMPACVSGISVLSASTAQRLTLYMTFRWKMKLV